MKIKMTKTERGSLNGIEIREFKSGQVYEVNESLGNVFVRVLGIAQEIVDSEEKMVVSSPENKSLSPEETKEIPDTNETIYKARKRK